MAAGMTRSVRAQRQAAEGADLLFELARTGRLDRQVSRVVRARGDLVDEQSAGGGQEEFDGQDPDGPEGLRRRQRQPRASRATIGPTAAGISVRVEDVPLVTVQADRIADGSAVGAAGHHHGDLGGELDPALGDAGRPAQAGPGA